MFHQHSDPSSFNPFAVESVRPPGAKGLAPGADQEEPDPDWHPL
ncbi:MAG TPA: hypothetical protein VFE77_11400 [Rhodanobacter sp.]|nr:hypothetical protein [Rhodanobacter sp.]